jgi:phospholipid transport system substrate-binding protein
MKIKLFLQLIIFCFFVNFAHAVQISESEARQWVAEKGNLLLDTFSEKDLETKHEKLDYLFLNHVDLDYIAQFVMGRYWRQMSEEQRERYKDLFTRYSLGVYKGFPLDFKDRINFRVTAVETRARHTDVSTFIQMQGAPSRDLERILVVFRLHKSNGSIKIIDIKLFESSLILSYRSRFTKMVTDAEEDIEWFLEELQDVVESTEENNRRRLRANNS